MFAGYPGPVMKRAFPDRPMRSLVIIEDEPDIAALLASCFEAEGFRVATVGDGRSGVRAVLERRPQLVLLDLLLPEVTGWEVLRTLKDNLTTQNIPVIVLSALGGVEERIKLLEDGIDDFIVKPFSVKEVIARARAVLRRAELRPWEPGGRDAADGDRDDSPRR